MKIVSLIPEATEILEALGAGDALVALPTSGLLDTDALARALGEARPTLIFTARTPAGAGPSRQLVRRAASRLRPRPAVFALEPRSVGEILADVKTVGDAIGRPAQARALVDGLRARIDVVSLRAANRVARAGARRVACLAALDPPLAAGWWLAELIGLAGGNDVLDGVGRPPRPTTWDEIVAARPELVVWRGERGARSVGRTHQPPTIAVVGGLQAGPGVVDALEWLAGLLHPPA